MRLHDATMAEANRPPLDKGGLQGGSPTEPFFSRHSQGESLFTSSIHALMLVG